MWTQAHSQPHHEQKLAFTYTYIHKSNHAMTYEMVYTHSVERASEQVWQTE